MLGVTANTVAAWRNKYKKMGLDSLEDAPRPGRPKKISDEQRAQIVALAKSDPPEGLARWDLRLLADKIVEMGICESISHAQVGKILKEAS
jgi:transposase